MLQEACNQAFAALGQTDLGDGTKFQVGAPLREGGPDADAVVAAFELSLGEGFSPVVVAWGRVTAVEVAAAPPSLQVVAPAAAASAPAAKAALAAEPSTSQAAQYPNLDVILDIDLPLSVRFGETEMTRRRPHTARPGLRHRPRPVAGRRGRRARQRPDGGQGRGRRRGGQLRRPNHRSRQRGRPAAHDGSLGCRRSGCDELACRGCRVRPVCCSSSKSACSGRT